MTLAARPVEHERLRSMLLIRQLELRLYSEYCRPRLLPNGDRGMKIGGFLALCTGQEALAVGVGAVYRRGVDAFVNGFRNHGYAVALGTTPHRVVAEAYGRATGCSGGRGGALYLFDADRHNLGGWYVAGGQVPMGVGAALAAARRRTGGVAFVALGDGALGQGAVHESLNLASLLNLPAVFLVEDNGIAMGTQVERHSADPDLASRAAGHAMPAQTSDGNDLDAVIEHLSAAADRARAGGGPTFLVARTYRLHGFSMSDPRRYRTKADQQAAEAREPIGRYIAKLRAAGRLTDAELAELGREVEAEIEDAVARAEQDPDPRVDSRFGHVLAGTYPQHGW